MFRDELAHLQTIERRRIVMPGNVKMRIGRLEKPEPWPAELVEEIRRTAPFDLMQQYPAYPAFYDRLAAWIGVPEDRIVVGAGIEEFIRQLMAACFGQRMAVLWPSCAMVDVYAKSFNVDLDRIITDPRQPPSIESIIDRVGSETRLVMLANPGQPVETCYSVKELRYLAAACEQRGAVLAIDEAYYGFGAPSAMELINDRPYNEFDNVLVMRTFSKAFGAAGIRLGFAAGGAKVIKMLNAVRQSGEVSSFSMHVATALMDNYERFVVPSIREICASRHWLRRHVIQAGFQAWGEHANHVLIDLRTPERAQKTAAALAARGIYVRACGVDPLASCLLVTCGSLDLARAFFAEFQAS